eukprot:superscaffoldBa00000558_g5623
MFKCWNTDWKPAHFMVDYSTAEIKAYESVFEETKALLCDLHRANGYGSKTIKCRSRRMLLERRGQLPEQTPLRSLRRHLSHNRKFTFYHDGC